MAVMEVEDNSCINLMAEQQSKRVAELWADRE